MRVARGFGACRQTRRGCIVAIGNFDGLHLGHQAIVARIREAGRMARLPAAVLTFEPHPREFFAPESAPARLMRLRDKAAMLGLLGVDALQVLRFDAGLAALDAEAFVERILVGTMGARRIVIGEDFRFGRGRGGDAAMLHRAGARHGFDVETLAPTIVGGVRVSSTRVRDALATGALDEAASLLGRPYRMSGRVIAGEKLGRKLGFPTANVRTQRRVSPVAGIFAVRVRGAGPAELPGVASVGTRPTIGGTEWLLEVHLFDFEGDLYRRRLDVDFVARLRDEVRFRDLDAMTAQMHRDARRARELLDA